MIWFDMIYIYNIWYINIQPTTPYSLVRFLGSSQSWGSPGRVCHGLSMGGRIVYPHCYLWFRPNVGETWRLPLKKMGQRQPGYRMAGHSLGSQTRITVVSDFRNFRNQRIPEFPPNSGRPAWWERLVADPSVPRPQDMKIHLLPAQSWQALRSLR